ncbi:hypothetical protein QMZ92_14150 [Streptomyces sp. HNM0645]|uniref:hypothetical protein n=1 Tax=Streptomyces sp. HNM0645 TaxID=2782343 RepID=UPI0024B6C90F|nr:hypothetical protein [Streptomyces sp. HNM0645]MDI9885505.1 hypothetical protein [Streptomyces sp. HNM0645]
MSRRDSGAGTPGGASAEPRSAVRDRRNANTTVTDRAGERRLRDGRWDRHGHGHWRDDEDGHW